MSVLPQRPLGLISRQKRYSFGFMVALLAVTGWLHLGGLLLTSLFGFLLLHVLNLKLPKSTSIAVFFFVIAVTSYVLVTFGTQAVVALPKVAQQAIPSIVAYAQQHGKELPFTDWDSLKNTAMAGVMEQAHYLTNVAEFATNAARLLVQFIIGLVVAVSLFLNSKINLDRDEPDSLYGLCSQEIAARFRTFYGSFSTVMGAQMIISAINTALTGVFVAFIGLPHHIVLIGVTFLCGLLPVVGNLISNCIIVAVAFTKSPETALWSLGFLVVIHKLEYFLNSKIVGDRIKNPIWLTLLGLVVGEMLMGVTGMILAPVFLHYLKVEASKIRLPNAPEDNPEEYVPTAPEPASRA